MVKVTANTGYTLCDRHQDLIIALSRLLYYNCLMAWNNQILHPIL